MYLKHYPKKNRMTEFDEEGNPVLRDIEFDELGRPLRRKYFWEF